MQVLVYAKDIGLAKKPRLFLRKAIVTVFSGRIGVSVEHLGTSPLLEYLLKEIAALFLAQWPPRLSV
jgi:hypothetical protein